MGPRLADFRRCGPRCLRIALVVGTIITIVHQAGRLAHATPLFAVRVGVNYVTPFVVSSLGRASAQLCIRAETAADAANR